MRRSPRGFTLLEVVVAMAILALSLMAIFDLNAGAIAMHAYTKKVTVASLLARSKMTDIEQDLYDKGFPADDEERSGDFSEEGWSSFKWRAKIIAPRTQGVSTEKVLGAIFGLPLDGDGDSGLAGIASMFGGAGGAPGGDKGGAAGAAGAGALASAGPMAGLAQAQMTQFLDQISQVVREVHLTVTWRDGKQVESVDLVTHIVSMGPGSDRNGIPGQQNSGTPGVGANGLPGVGANGLPGVGANGLPQGMNPGGLPPGSNPLGSPAPSFNGRGLPAGNPGIFKP